MKRHFLFVMILSLVFSASGAMSQTRPSVPVLQRDDFASRPRGSDGTPGWEPLNAGWEMLDGAYVGDDGKTFWQAVPQGSVASFACDVTVLEQLRGEWLTAGIGLAGDDGNYWAINLVVAPESQKRRHMYEMHESFGGHWLAESQHPTKLTVLHYKAVPADWQVNKTYRFEIQLREKEVVGCIRDGATELMRAVVRLDAGVPAVRAGRPILRVSGLRVRFANAVATVEQVAPELPRPPITPWTSREGQPVARGSGFFRVALMVDGKEVPHASASQAEMALGRWWLIDPEGKAFFDVGVDHVSYRGHWCESLGYSPYYRNVEAKFGNEKAWAVSALERLKVWGFNTLPAGHSPSLRRRGMPHILFAAFGTNFARREWICQPIHWTGFPDVFSPRWETHCRAAARRIALESKGDPWCLGVFLDNELEWYGKKGQLVDEVFVLGSDRPAKKALFQWLMKRYGSLGELNRQLGLKCADEQAFLALQEMPKPSPALLEVRSGFLAEIADRYFGTAARAMREADGDHMILGCRFAGQAPEAVLAAAGKYNDVFTFNTYPRVEFEHLWRPDGAGGSVRRVPRELADMYKVVRRPMIITEWGFPALDSGLPCKHGAGMRVDTQAQKSACYRVFATAMADLPFMLGYHYFMWADEPAAGISSSFPEDSNYGLVNEKDETYELLTKTAGEVNHGAFARHARSMPPGDLELRTTADAVEVINLSDVPARGVLRILSDGNSRVEEVPLSPRETRRLNIGAAGAWCAELQQWDGTRQRRIGGRRLAALEVANISPATVESLPVVLDGPRPVAAEIEKLAPGRVQSFSAPATELAEANRLELKAGDVTWICDRRSGNLFDEIRAGDLPIGRFVFAVHAVRDGQNHWLEARRVDSLKVQEQRDAWLIEAEVSCAQPGVPQYRAGLRGAVFKKGGVAMAKPMWVENTDSRPWQLANAYWFCRSAIGGDPADDEVGGPGVPDYYLAANFITDGKLGGCFGTLGDSAGWHSMFWKDPGGMIHPDTRWTVERELQPRRRWTADYVSYLWVFALRDARGWREVARKHRQAGELVTASSR